MILTLVGMSQEEYSRGPFWVTLPRASGVRPLILGVEDRYQPRDYLKFCAEYGEFFQFLLLNDDAVLACNAAQIKLDTLASVESGDLTDEPTLLAGEKKHLQPKPTP